LPLSHVFAGRADIFRSPTFARVFAPKTTDKFSLAFQAAVQSDRREKPFDRFRAALCRRPHVAGGEPPKKKRKTPCFCLT